MSMGYGNYSTNAGFDIGFLPQSIAIGIFILMCILAMVAIYVTTRQSNLSLLTSKFLIYFSTLKRYVQVISIKHDIKREYISFGIPLIIGIIVIIAALATGHTFLPKEEGSSDDSNARKIAYQQMVEQLEASGNETDISSLPLSDETESKSKDDMDHFVIFATLIAIIPYSIDTFFQKRRFRSKEKAFSEFLYKLSELMRGGIDPVKGVIILSRTDLGPITNEIRNAAASMVLGNSFEDSMNRIADDIKSKLIKKYVDIVVQAAYTGGDVADLMFRTSEDMRTVINIDREKEASLQQYIIIFYLAQGIIVMLTYILSGSLLPMIQGIGLELMGGEGLNDINFQQGFFHMLCLNGFFGGIIIGQISEGEPKHGLKHAAILIIFSYLASTSLILPTADLINEMNVELVSGGNQEVVIGGLPVNEPLIFQVTDADGNPVGDIFVEASISPSGIVQGAATSENGQVSIVPVIGNEPGTYIVTVTAGNSKATGTIRYVN